MSADGISQHTTVRSKALLRYWRACVSDSTLGKGRFRQSDVQKFVKLTETSLRNGRIAPLLADKLFTDQPGNPRVLSVRIWPNVFARQTSHGTARDDGLPECVAPIVTEAQLTREGFLLPGRTAIARDLLEPLAAGSFSIGTVAKLDEYLTQSPYDAESEAEQDDKRWQSYQTYCHKLLQAVAGEWVDSDATYSPMKTGFLELGEEASATIRGILALYDDLISTAPETPLLNSYARTDAAPLSRTLSRPYELAARQGHSNDRFPLAAHQHDVLAHLATLRHGGILAVNGPPGTGKTTMLLSAIAGAWARAALEGGEPEVIIAASANNQAVTNIIDAFGKDFATGEGPFAGRWLPGIKSFGLFLCSAARQAEASLKYQTESFFQEIETPNYVARARQDYLDRARHAFPDERIETVEGAVSCLHARIKGEASYLTALDRGWVQLEAATAALSAGLGPDPQATLTSCEAAVARSQGDIRSAGDLIALWDRHMAGESVFMALFAFLPPISRKRLVRAKVLLEGAGHVDLAAQVQKLDAFNPLLRDHERQARQRLDEAEAHLMRARTLIADADHAQSNWAGAVGNLAPAAAAVDIERCEQIADCSTRFSIFLLTTHYWEGRWLIEMGNILPEIEAEQRRTGRKSVVPRWRRRMMLTPCAVATFASLPGKMTFSRRTEGAFRDEYLYNFIDLLIVDEAGQVLPETAAPAFALARTALVIGDRQQIEPISTLPRAIDVGNLIESGVLPKNPGDPQVEKILNTGIASTSGSAMWAAQNACVFHPYPDLDRGLYLFEHRRCYDEIISFCSALCYKGTLQPRRGEAGVSPLPPLGYLQVDGIAYSAKGSRSNPAEALIIATWLAAQRQILEQHYDLPLEQIVGIVTPFGGQAIALREACAKQGVRVGGGGAMTIGTVHALQGAERPIVLFSPVYSKHADGPFIDASPSMLNVAVSRAKDSFLVVGDMDLFSIARPGTPRAVLASFLFSRPGNALEFEAQPRQDLEQAANSITMLRDAEEHDTFLSDVLKRCQTRVVIVSPWIITATMQRNGILDLLAASAARGVRIDIYADPLLNEGQVASGQTRFAEARAALAEIGVTLSGVRQLHSKIVLADNELLAIGSFNWLSADRLGQYARHETTVVYRGAHLAQEIATIEQSLAMRDLRKEGTTAAG